MPASANFFADVYQVVRLIPSGRVTSYGAIARYLGTGISARMVGWAMNSVHFDETVPAHRVVNRNGVLTGKHHFGALNNMQELLEKEGLIIKKDKIQSFEDHNWDPMVELSI